MHHGRWHQYFWHCSVTIDSTSQHPGMQSCHCSAGYRQTCLWKLCTSESRTASASSVINTVIYHQVNMLQNHQQKCSRIINQKHSRETGPKYKARNPGSSKAIFKIFFDFERDWSQDFIRTSWSCKIWLWIFWAKVIFHGTLLILNSSLLVLPILLKPYVISTFFLAQIKNLVQINNYISLILFNWALFVWWHFYLHCCWENSEYMV